MICFFCTINSQWSWSRDFIFVVKTAFVDHLILPLSRQHLSGSMHFWELWPFFLTLFSMICNLMASELVNEVMIYSPLAKKIKKKLQCKCSCASSFPKTQNKEQQKTPSKNVIEYKVILQITNLFLMAPFGGFFFNTIQVRSWQVK